jgi:uncharacterized protein (DUF362 family)
MIIRWICEKDNKKWLYPINKCLYCKGPITKQKSSKAKIIGVTKVNIPSPMHPVIPYHIMLLEDEFGNRMPKKTMKERKIGETYEAIPAKTDNAVVIEKVKYDLGEALSEGVSLLNSFPFAAGDKVLLKVSCIEPAYSYQAVTTNPKLIELMAEILRQKGVTDIAVGEQASLGNDTMDCAAKSGVLDACKKANVPFIDLGKGEFVEKKGEGISFSIAKEAIERKIIDIPVMKTHAQIGVAGAIENLLRCCAPSTQKEMHAQDIEKTLPKLFAVLKPTLVVGDATSGLQGNGPTALGEPAFLHTLLIGKDALTIDRAFSEIGMFQLPLYLKEAGRLGIGEIDLRKIEAVNYEIEAVKFSLKQPTPGATAHSNIHLIDGKADPYIFGTSLRMAQKLVGIAGDEVNLIIGSHLTPSMVEGKRRLVLYGEDAIKKGREMGVEAVAELTEEMPDIQKVVFLKSILENPDKKKLGIADTFKAKLAMFSQKKK